MYKKYIYALFSAAVSGQADKIAVDQLLPPTNMKRYLRYFHDDLKVIVTDRDPRDIFILDKYVWKDGIVPSDPETFCKWYRYTRSHRKKENMNTGQVMFLPFEDLVFKYSRTTKKIRDWLGLDEQKHIYKKDKFNPAVSVKNTQTWKRYKRAQKEADYIQKNLNEYLYDFDAARRKA